MHADPIQHLSVDSDADGQNPRTDVDEIFGDLHLSGHNACSLGGPHHGCEPNRVDRIYDVTIARHQTGALLECYYNSVLDRY